MRAETATGAAERAAETGLAAGAGARGSVGAKLLAQQREGGTAEGLPRSEG